MARPEATPSDSAPSDSAPSDSAPSDPTPAAREDERGGDPKLDSTTTADAGWEATKCAGVASRHLAIVGNLDPQTVGIVRVDPLTWTATATPFDPSSPWTTSNFSTTIVAVDDHGRRQSISVCFGRRDSGWDYDVIMDGTTYLIGSGHLAFDEAGALDQVTVTQALRLLTADGPGHAIELDLSGMTSSTGPCNIRSQAVDGSNARWGVGCPAAPATVDEPAIVGPECAPVATNRVALRANLGGPSLLTMPLRVTDPDGTPLDFSISFHPAGARRWDYRVSFASVEAETEVASGSLLFNDNGSLRSVETKRPLRFPNLAGEPIALDFGATTADGGTGVDGVTALPGDSLEVWQADDGVAFSCLAPAGSPTPIAHDWRCGGERTTMLFASTNLDPATSIGDSYRTISTAYDAQLEPREVEVAFTRVGALRWQCRFASAGNELATADLYLSSWGGLERVDGPGSLRFPLADGSAGPPIQVGWEVTSFDYQYRGGVWANGTPPNAIGCAP